MTRRRSTYEENILIKNILMNKPEGASTTLDLMQLGIPPRPQKELFEEIKLISKAESDTAFFDRIEKMRDKYKSRKAGFKQTVDEKDKEIKALNERIEKLRIELKKAIFILRNKVIFH